VKIVVLLLLLFAASRISVEWSSAVRIAYRIGLLAAYPVALSLAGVYSWSSFSALIRELRAK